MSFNQPDLELKIVEPEQLNWDTYTSPFVYEQRVELPCVGNEQAVTIRNAASKKFKFQVPGGNRHSKHRVALKYDMVPPRSGLAGAYSATRQLAVSSTEVSEMGTFKYKVSNSSSNWVDIQDVAQYSHEQSITCIDYSKRSSKDRILFNSARFGFRVPNVDPNVTDPYYQLIDDTAAVDGYSSLEGINGLPVIFPNTHSNMITFNQGVADDDDDLAYGKAARTQSVEIDIKDFAPNTIFDVNLIQRHNADDLYEIEFKKPIDVFFIKDDITDDGLFRPCVAADIASYEINNLQLVYYNAVTYDKDDDEVLKKIDEASYTFFYPHPEADAGTFSSSTGTAQKQDIMINLTSTNGICIYKLFAMLYKDDSVNGLPTNYNSCNFVSTGQFNRQQKYNHVQYILPDGKVGTEYYANNYGLEKMIKAGCNYDNSFTNQFVYQNWGGLIHSYDTEIMPKDPYNPQILRGRRLTDQNWKSGFRLSILPPKLKEGGDVDNPNNKFRYSITAIVFKKATILKGDISY